MPLQVSNMVKVVPLMERKKENKKITWVNATQLAKYFGFSKTWVSQRSHREFDPIPHERIAGSIRYNFEAVKEWEERNTEKFGDDNQ